MLKWGVWMANSTGKFPRCDRTDCMAAVESVIVSGEYICIALSDNEFLKPDGTPYRCPFYKQRKKEDANDD